MNNFVESISAMAADVAECMIYAADGFPSTQLGFTSLSAMVGIVLSFFSRKMNVFNNLYFES